MRSDVLIPPHDLPGVLYLPPHPVALVIFAHGSGSSRLSPRNIFVAEKLVDRGLACLLFDLLTADESEDRRNVFDIPLLAERVCDALRWVPSQEQLVHLPIGLFGASTGAAAALVAACDAPMKIAAVVSRGGRPDLARDALRRVKAPSLLIVGGWDDDVLALNRDSLAKMQCEARLEIVPGATHLFEERGALEEVVTLAGAWFLHHAS
ncbi:Putative phosphoribosyl transferase [freshwater sediment metagenome]|uniref:Phosphoribosyl transferase n=1 Tax=freshwater sediment metagenome TaxID=556182 RepID=A0AA48REL1_9ZZZZ